MKSKRSDYTVITDKHISLEMRFFSDGGRGSIITLTNKDIQNLAKQSNKRLKKLKKGYFVHLCPEISFFITGK